MNSLMFYTATGAFVGGLLVRSFFMIDLPTVTWLLLIAFALAVVYRLYGEERLLLLCVVALCALSVGVLRYQMAEESWPVVTPSPDARIEGVVVREPDERENSTHLYVASGEQRYLVIVPPYTPVAYGDRLQLVGELERPEAFETEFGRTFDYPGYLKARGVALMMRYPDELTVVGSDEGVWLIARLLLIKEYFTTALALVLPEPAQGLGAGILLGEKRALGEALLEDFRRAGIVHIVVLSGYNVMLVVGFLLFTLSFILPRRYRMWGGLLGIVAFALMVGLSATVARASLMAALCVVAYSLGRQYAVMRGLMVAAVIMLALNPYLLLYDIGFQLSFVATVGLIVALQVVDYLELSGLRKFVVGLILTTIATQVAVLPLLMYHIGEVSLVAVLVNLLIVPMVPVAMALTFAAGLSTLIHPLLGMLAAYPAFLALSYMILVASVAATLPFATAVVPPLPGYLVPVAYLLLGGAYWYVRAWPHRGATGAADWTIETEAAEGRRPSAASVQPAETPIYFR